VALAQSRSVLSTGRSSLPFSANRYSARGGVLLIKAPLDDSGFLQPLQPSRQCVGIDPFALTAEFGQEAASCQDSNVLVLAQGQQILVAGDDNFSVDGDRGRDDMVVIGIAADRTDFGQGAANNLPISTNSTHQASAASSA
jgi:hypothetical protein